MSVEDFKNINTSVQEELKKLKDSSQKDGERFLADLEEFGIEGAEGIRELSAIGSEDLKKFLMFSLKDKTNPTVDSLTQDQKIILASYLEAKYGDTYIDFSKLSTNHTDTVERLKDGLDQIILGSKVIKDTQRHLAHIAEINTEHDLLVKVPNIETKGELGFLIKLLIEKSDGIPNGEMLKKIRTKSPVGAFDEYFKSFSGIDKRDVLTMEEQRVIALYSMLYLGAHEYSLKGGDDLQKNSEYYKKHFIARLDAREKSIDTVENDSSIESEIYEKFTKKYEDLTQGDLHVLASQGNMGKYFLHNADGGEMDFSVDSSVKGKEYIAYFHENLTLNRHLSLGALLGSISGNDTVITEISVLGTDGKYHKAELKYPSGEDKLGYHYTDGYKDADGDKYVEVFDYTRFQITKVESKAAINKVEEKEETKSVENYHSYQRIENEEIRGGDVAKNIFEALVLGGMDHKKLHIGEVEALKEAGYDISKLFLTDGEGKNPGVEDLIEGQKVQFNPLNQHLNEKLSAGLILAPQLFGDTNYDGNIVTEIEVNGEHGVLKNIKGKVGFYGTGDRKKGDPASSFDSGKNIYRRIYAGDVIKIIKKEKYSEYSDRKNLGADGYKLNKNNVKIAGINDGEMSGLVINPLTNTPIDKKLLLRELDERFEQLGKPYSDYIKAEEDSETGEIIYSVMKEDTKGFEYNMEYGSASLTKELRQKLLNVQYRRDTVGTLEQNAAIHESIRNGTYKGRFASPPLQKRYNPNINKWVTLCGRTYHEYRTQKLGLDPVTGHAPNIAMSFGSYRDGKIKESHPSSKSTVKAVVDGEATIHHYAQSNIDSFDCFDIFSTGTGSYAKKYFNKPSQGYVGHSANGVKIAGKLYVVDPYYQGALSGKRSVKRMTDTPTGRDLQIISYDKMKLIPLDEYMTTHKVRRVVFHDSPTIDNDEASGNPGVQIDKNSTGSEKLDSIYKVMSTKLSNKDMGSGIGIPRENFKVYGKEILKAVYSKAPAAGLDPVMILAQMYQESGFNKIAGSSAGAKGVMQFTGPTWIDYGNRQDIYDIEANIDAGIRYMKKLVKDFGNMEEALRGYNGGPGHIWNLRNNNYRKKNKDTGKITYNAPDENKKYVPEIMKKYNILKGMGL